MPLSRRGFFGAAVSIPMAASVAGKSPLAASTPVTTREYELDRFCVAGFRFHDGPQFLPNLKVGETLELVREPGNPHDDQAVALFHQDHRIGYVPRVRNSMIARLLDQGAPLYCRMTVVSPHAEPWNAVEVAIGITGIMGTSG